MVLNNLRFWFLLVALSYLLQEAQSQDGGGGGGDEGSADDGQSDCEDHCGKGKGTSTTAKIVSFSIFGFIVFVGCLIQSAQKRYHKRQCAAMDASKWLLGAPTGEHWTMPCTQPPTEALIQERWVAATDFSQRKKKIVRCPVFHVRFDADISLEGDSIVYGNGTDSVGDYDISGLLRRANGRLAMRQKYMAGTGNIKKNKGQSVELRLQWQNARFEGTWHVARKGYCGCGMWVMRAIRSEEQGADDTRLRVQASNQSQEEVGLVFGRQREGHVTDERQDIEGGFGRHRVKLQTDEGRHRGELQTDEGQYAEVGFGRQREGHVTYETQARDEDIHRGLIGEPMDGTGIVPPNHY